MRSFLRKMLTAFVVVGLVTGGTFAFTDEEASAKRVEDYREYKKNKITGKESNSKWFYKTVPNNYKLQRIVNVKQSSGIINDTWRAYWIWGL
ncbi:hypothetical protein J32TS2_27400 [Shouchella clausii]|jgi:high-affinity Fe2+/Pb2+ permease|uniref:Uncharacterized protein n=1 Tax=Shouchella clausii TaxID=79880 RepID=A0A268NVP6_SHOCL|nr:MULTISPECIES: hypothetical protein [Shouchella]KKI88261.1 hypothetical protein WZ76_00330 [Shouchella clausii]MCM3380644.1 hypothetical protein [Shouchella rhizosphaerae]PAD46532.1 hypothetical protein CHI09_11700 [Shouchella clausii]PAE80134.1 hypothetical protein CHH77_17655 [Shouchella clausii]PAE87546.1 hypothetical protein CHH72_17660 [Shouchella clausii]